MKKLLFLFAICGMISGTVYSQWSPQNSGTTQDFWGIAFADENVGYAGGGPWQFTSSCVIAKTEDGGQTWIVQNPVSMPSCIFGVNALSPDTIFAVGCNATSYYGLILRSFDGGENWTVKNIANTWGFYCVEFPNESTGYTCGWNGRIYKTVNAGDTWTSLSTGTSQTFRRMCFVDKNLGFAACGSDHASTNKIYKTTDGSSWSLIKNFGSSFIIGGMYFFDENTGVVAGTDGSKAVIKRTIDGGQNWDDVLPGNYAFVLECLHFDGESGWAAGKYGSSNGVFYSSDAGQNWELDFTGLTGTPYSVYKYDSVSFIAGTGGMIMKNTESPSTGLMEIENRSDLIYPNPTSGFMRVNLTSFSNKMNFELIDMRGSTMLAEYNVEPSEYVYDTSSWIKGVYVLKVWENQFKNICSQKIIIN